MSTSEGQELASELKASIENANLRFNTLGPNSHMHIVLTVWNPSIFGRRRSSYKVSDLLRKQYTKQQNNGP